MESLQDDRPKWLSGRWSPLVRTVETAYGRRWTDLCNPDGPGLYRLIALEDNEQGFVPASLNRVCGIDHTGTLYIGKTSSLRSRLRSLVRTNNPSFLFGGGHAHMPHTLRRRFPFQLRAITWLRSSDLSNGEAELFEKYTKRFGELPPMNLNG
jgi:hypothetical protein